MLQDVQLLLHKVWLNGKGRKLCLSHWQRPSRIWQTPILTLTIIPTSVLHQLWSAAATSSRGMSTVSRWSIKVLRQVIFGCPRFRLPCAGCQSITVLGHRDGLGTGTTVYFHIHNMIPVSDPEDTLKTLEMENFQLPSSSRFRTCRSLSAKTIEEDDAAKISEVCHFLHLLSTNGNRHKQCEWL